MSGRKRIDIIRDGVTPTELRAEGQRAVWRALVSTAASAMQDGVTEPHWIAEISDPRSRLGGQVAVRRGRPVTAAQQRKTLARAWSAAAKWLENAEPAWTREDVTRRLAEIRDVIAHPDAQLHDTHRAILAHAVDVAMSIGTNRPALPRRRIAEATGLRDREVRTALEQMHDAGLLVAEVRGRPGPDPARRRATCYRLPDPARVPIPEPVNRPMGHEAPAHMPMAVEPTDPAHMPMADGVVTVTVAGSPAALVEALRLLAAAPDVEVTPTSSHDVGDANIVPIERGRRAS